MAEEQILINYREIESRKGYHIVKRIFDIVLSAIGLVVLSPVMVVIAYKIKKEDGGPVFYKQERISKNGSRFKMYKFRSMVPNADQLLGKLRNKNEVEGAMFKIKHDPRITKVGHYIREHSLDELPQLVNVLKGDMSLVGPRPPLPSEVEQYTDYDKQRLYVVPGCTGLWQATSRNEVGFDGMVKLDLEYIQRANMFYDFLIICKTIFVIFKPNSSY
ncbi:multidrug MFS transporter [Limosilactobacillus reuteri]|uniref:sugar transferase n=1 Tax=Limosilactobacillus reuteri TaxID=1598 RepID=UPI0007A953FA|nr:sugar transferase [Limosilactobacillus reuteri]AMY14996.1 multidrug MFS transporter [Limosilactobacillus reuteri]